MSTDRNLLFGMLALHHGISQEQLIDSMTAWMARKQTPLGDTPRQHGDSHKSIASLRLDGAVCRELERPGRNAGQTEHSPTRYGKTVEALAAVDQALPMVRVQSRPSHATLPPGCSSAMPICRVPVLSVSSADIATQLPTGTRSFAWSPIRRLVPSGASRACAGAYLRAAKGGHFREPANVAHLHKDDDLAFLSDCANYRAFVGTLATTAKP